MCIYNYIHTEWHIHVTKVNTDFKRLHRRKIVDRYIARDMLFISIVSILRQRIRWGRIIFIIRFSLSYSNIGIYTFCFFYYCFDALSLDILT